jgi:putative sporulation protein YyaC
MINYINSNSPDAKSQFKFQLQKYLDLFYSKNEFDALIFLCIGTDRSTGDSLAPLIGYKLQNLQYNNVYIYGCLEDTVNAKNVEDIVKEIHNKFNNPFIVAIDACLGQMDHVGYMTVSDKPIKPGSGVGKDITPVGNISITAIVNFGGFMDFLILQNTRLNIVMKLADIISESIREIIPKVMKRSSKNCIREMVKI